MFWVIGLFVTYQSARAQGSVAAVNRLPYPSGADNEMAAAAGNTSWRTVIAAGNPAMEKVVWHDVNDLRVAEPVAGYPATPWGKLIGAVTNATAEPRPRCYPEKSGDLIQCRPDQCANRSHPHRLLAAIAPARSECR